MARKIVHQIVDDIDGTVLEIGEGETVHFSVDGTSYEIDLSEENASAFRAALAPYTGVARKAQRSGGGQRPASRKRTSRNPETAQVRVWAAENGYTISERGRIPANVLEAFRAAH